MKVRTKNKNVYISIHNMKKERKKWGSIIILLFNYTKAIIKLLPGLSCPSLFAGMDLFIMFGGSCLTHFYNNNNNIARRVHGPRHGGPLRPISPFVLYIYV